ncbi:hypothetical protein [Nocardia pseudovaccinii]|uniref:hypothetical protein n=1 Tax=Nocardia pseudovaccinii TaxID=189540 RepID=UPI0007A3BD8E|nr:hypothetical protein [Nocardia pseudovaccinii]
MNDVARPRKAQLSPPVRKLLAVFHEEAHFKLDLAPVDSAPIYQRADGSVMPVDEDGWVCDSDAELDKDDAITIQPTSVRDREES